MAIFEPVVLAQLFQICYTRSLRLKIGVQENNFMSKTVLNNLDLVYQLSKNVTKWTQSLLIHATQERKWTIILTSSTIIFRCNRGLQSYVRWFYMEVYF